MTATGNAVWSSRFAFIMASVGFAVGLGNIWRFPYVTGENGGSAFVLIYLLCAVAIGIPCLMAELLVGRRGRGSPPTAQYVCTSMTIDNPRPSATCLCLIHVLTRPELGFIIMGRERQSSMTSMQKVG